MSEITVILTTYNRSVDLIRTLQAYNSQTCLQASREPFEILVVDDASTDDTWERLQNFHPQNYRLRIERMERNSGPGKARNRAIPQVTTPLLLFSGDDMLPEKTFLEAHLAAHRLFPDEKLAILGQIFWPKDLPVNTLMQHIDGVGAQQFSYHYLQDGEEYDFRHLYTSNISLKTSLIHTLDHYFDPEFTSAAYEDADLGYRLSKKGLRIRYTSVPVAYHYHYHNVYSFARRQYASGKMAFILVKKHPELARIIYGKGLKYKLIFARLINIVDPFLYTRKQAAVQEVNRLEHILLRLLSFYENQPQPLLDNLYMKSFQYFLYKGILEGNVRYASNQSAEIQPGWLLAGINWLLIRRISKIFYWYIPQARKIGVPLPQGFNHSIFPF